MARVKQHLGSGRHIRRPFQALTRENACVSSFRLVVLASGSGTNLQAILDKLHGQEEIEVVGVGSDKPAAGALERGRRVGVETAVFSGADYPDRTGRDE